MVKAGESDGKGLVWFHRDLQSLDEGWNAWLLP